METLIHLIFFSAWYKVGIIYVCVYLKVTSFVPMAFIKLLIFHLWPAVRTLPPAKLPCVTRLFLSSLSASFIDLLRLITSCNLLVSTSLKGLDIWLNDPPFTFFLYLKNCLAILSFYLLHIYFIHIYFRISCVSYTPKHSIHTHQVSCDFVWNFIMFIDYLLGGNDIFTSVYSSYL